MGKFSNTLTKKDIDFIASQHIFFTATAPFEGRINVSPKGMNSFRVINENEVAYLDLTGSGNESASHILENKRLTIMMCAFEGKPNILRMYGKGEVILKKDAEWEDYFSKFNPIDGVRQIIKLKIESVQNSCGMAVPFFDYNDERRELENWATQKGEPGLLDYQNKNNLKTIDDKSNGITSYS
ncbi:pyridoxamine 5'-phosphate oxidase family protein [Flexithrix dorotheae]|uniref:pyridoxamine 5'-phosphate oxidase family protein n=1 Tax=Flexithrix dorotheae TaxID=70993 RepID=UPI000381CF58|nr:pyridoxamine 5'-phosphate oxidase family protein [Flexithrix dorotheae]